MKSFLFSFSIKSRTFKYKSDLIIPPASDKIRIAAINVLIKGALRSSEEKILRKETWLSWLNKLN